MTSTSGRSIAGCVVVTRRRRASASKLTPCSTVESSTTKKTIARNSCARGTPAMTGNVAKTIGTAPRSPAHDIAACSARVKRSGASSRCTATGRPSSSSAAVMTSPSTQTSPSAAGVTSSPSERNIASCATQARPSWNAVMERLPWIGALPSSRPAT